MTRIRLDKDDRHDIIVTAAVRVALDQGLASVTHGTVAKRCTTHTTTRNVRSYFPTKADLWRAVLDGTDDPVVHSHGVALLAGE